MRLWLTRDRREDNLHRIGGEYRLHFSLPVKRGCCREHWSWAGGTVVSPAVVKAAKIELEPGAWGVLAVNPVEAQPCAICDGPNDIGEVCPRCSMRDRESTMAAEGDVGPPAASARTL